MFHTIHKNVFLHNGTQDEGFFLMTRETSGRPFGCAQGKTPAPMQ